LGDHELATDLVGADAEREWLRNFSQRLPGVRFHVEDMVIQGGPWSTRVATRCAVVHVGRILYRGVNFGRIAWGKIVEEAILPDAKAPTAALS
jgi:hypothetical protein